jgi:hypothetical protein
VLFVSPNLAAGNLRDERLRDAIRTGNGALARAFSVSGRVAATPSHYLEAA